MKNKVLIISAAVVLIILSAFLLNRFVIIPGAVAANERVIQIAIDRYQNETGRDLVDEERLKEYWIEVDGFKTLLLNNPESVQALEEVLEGFIVEIPPHPLTEGYFCDEYYYYIEYKENGGDVRLEVGCFD